LIEDLGEDLKTVNVYKRLRAPLKEALMDESEVLAIRFPVYYKLLYKMCLSWRKKEVLKSIIAAAIEALAVQENGEIGWRTRVEGVRVEMKLGVTVREKRAAPPKGLNSIL